MSFDVKDKTTAVYTAVIQDEDGNAIASSSLDTLTLTLYDLATGNIINSRDSQNVKNTNNVTVDNSGNLTWTMQPADNAIVKNAKEIERHVALFEWTFASGAKTGRHEVFIDVENFTKVS